MTRYIPPWAALLALLLNGCSSVSTIEQPVSAIALASDDIIKSPNDTRDYRYLELSNGLKVILISDPKADKAAASLSVYRGNFHDPADRLGLAHFLEHMLFIGTEKYPDVDGYFSYVQSNGGSSNAYTSSEHTNYFFDVQPEAFREGLDRFAQFFIAPLFDKDYVEREKNAVQSEYQLQIKDDGWRGFAVQKMVTNPDHPAAKFNIGSLETLSGDVHSTLLDFFENHYSANQMGLVILSPESLDEQQPWVTELFSQIRNRDLPDIASTKPVFKEDQLPAVLEYDNLKDVHTLSYLFPVPSLKAHFRKKPAAYLANLIGHEGEGSLHKQLNSLGWINYLSAGRSEVDDQNALMTVSMELTSEGAAHVSEISGYLFAYLDMLRDGNLKRWIYDEQAMVAEIGFQFAEKSSAIGAVQTLSPMLKHYKPRDILVAAFLMEDFDSALIKSYLDYLRPDNVMVVTGNPGYEGGNREPWFDVSYDVTPGPVEIAEVQTDVLSIPQPNPFLPERLDLVEADKDIPLPVIQTPVAEVYVDTDLEFGVPRAVTHVSLRNPGGLIALRDASLANVYAALVQDNLNALAYPALLAGVWYDIASPPKGFRLSIGGYEDKQFVLLEEVLTRLVGLEIDKDRFDVLKNEILKNLYNEVRNKPFQQAYGRLQDEVVSASWTAPQLISQIEPLTHEELAKWRDSIFAEVSVQALIHGNVRKSKAQALKALLARHVNLTDVVASEPVVHLISGSNVLPLEIEHDDAAMVLYVQNDSKAMTERARSAFLSHLIAPAYFSNLRTEQQLGYVVAATHAVYYDHGGLGFIIQSPVAGPGELRNRTLEFVDSQVDRLKAMSEEEFGTNKGGLITQLIQRDKNLGQRAQRYWSELDRGVTTFDARRQLAKVVSGLSRQDMLEFLDKVRLKLSQDYLMIISEGKFATSAAGD